MQRFTEVKVHRHPGEYCSVYFNGARSQEMKKEWAYIMYHMALAYQFSVGLKKIEIESLREAAEYNLEEVKKSKPFYRFWYTKAEKEKISYASIFLKDAHELEKEIEKMFSEFCDPYEKLINFLQAHKFVLYTCIKLGAEEIEYGLLKE